MSHFVIARIQIERLTLTQISDFLLRVSCPLRGTYASSRTLDAGCDGRFGGALTSAAEADGEAVWS
jgi:hypothetical protein